VVICLGRGADLRKSQLMPLPLTVSCFRKIQIGLPFWYRLTRVVLDKGLLNVCVCVYVCVRACVRACVCVCVYRLMPRFLLHDWVLVGFLAVIELKAILGWRNMLAVGR